jgi:hypothetical protein
VFGRSKSETTSSTTSVSRARKVAAEDAEPREGSKGRPTPKRREAERGRRRAVAAPRGRKEAYKRTRERQRGDRARQMEALKAGDERYLPARDRGPVRKYVRDMVDTRRSVAEFFLPLAVLILVLTTVGTPQMKLYGSALWVALLVLIIFDSIVLAFRLRRGLAGALPNEPHRGALPYALMRSMQIRRFRLPPPRRKSRGLRNKG